MSKRKAIRDSLARRAPELERRAFARFGRRRDLGFRVSRLLPILLGVSISLWVLAPDHMMRSLTPWVGAAALICAGLYLTRVVLRIGHFSNHFADSLGHPNHARLRELKRALYKMASVLIGVLCVSGGFFYLSAMTLANSSNPGEPGLLWSLTLGGLVLSIFFGEAVTRLIEFVEDVLEELVLANQPADPEHKESAPETDNTAQ